jgi:hypothetical protein
VAYKQLFIWVEGPDDMRFFNAVIKPLLAEKYDWIGVRSYAERKKEYITAFLKNIPARGDDYIFAADINSAPCITRKKQNLLEIYPTANEEELLIVIQEIESWYLAGLDEESAKNLGLRPLENTDDLTKEMFNDRIPKRFTSRIDFVQEILNYFSVETAKQKNTSFNYFIEKYI